MLKEDFINLFVFEQRPVKEIEKELNLSSEKRKSLEVLYADDIQDIRSVRKKFTKVRQQYFSNYKAFYNWYKEQPQECSYCGITQNELYKIFPKLLPLNNAVKRSSGILEIERFDSTTNTYSVNNIGLACPLCNNAKSNLIDEESWRNLFVTPIQKYYTKLLKTVK